MTMATIMRAMLVGLNIFRASSYSLTHQRLVGFVTSPRIAHGMRFMTTNDDGERISVSGTIYSADGDAPVVTLYTKDGCTLCDKVKDVRIHV